ncbi:MAG: hypothetical protein Q4D98_01470 [Planctomycetia bacterium]|nr:hypothetical protein [Planctomycetia bacterium]
MKRLAGIFLVFLGIFVLLIGVSLWVYGRSFTLTCTTEEEFTVDLPLQTVALNLMMSNVSDKIAERLGITILQKELVEKSGEISITAFLSGNWNIRTVEESDCELNDPNLGKMRMKIRTITAATPEKVVVQTDLVSPVGSLWDMAQTITITPLASEEKPDKKRRLGFLSAVLGKSADRTTIGIHYSTTVEINWPGVPVIRQEAEKRLEASHDKTVTILMDTLKETAEHPSFGFSPEAIPALEIPKLPPAKKEKAAAAKNGAEPATESVEEDSDEPLPFDEL